MITFTELKNKADVFYPAIVLERFSTYRSRRLTRTAILWLLTIIFILVVTAPFMVTYSYVPESLAAWFAEHYFAIRGVFFVVFTIWVCVYLFEAFYRSYYFKQAKIDFDVAKFALISNKDDITEGFLNSVIGKYTMLRLGISDLAVNDFIESADRKKIRDEQVDINVDLNASFIGIKDYGIALYRNDSSFSEFLRRYGVTEELFLGALEWVDYDEWLVRNAERWWSRERLSRVQSVGRNWSFGKTYTIEKFGHRIMSEPVYQNLGDKWRIHKANVEKIETVLVKSTGANVMITAPTSDIGLEIVASLGKMIMNGKIMTELEDKRIFVLDTNLLITDSAEKNKLEENLINILAQANSAGNVILAIPQLSSFIENAHNIDVDVASLFAEVLKSSSIQIIGITNQKGFHESVETNYDLMQHFEKIQISDIDSGVGLRILQEEAHRIESRLGVFFTFQSLHTIAKSAERFFVGETYSDKILDLLQEVANKVKSNSSSSRLASSIFARKGKKKKTGGSIITAEEVNKVVSIKTGVPQGKIGDAEKQQLMSLEENLHKRVVGQGEAIESISSTMRRGRAGVTNPKRPIGSFLFIGPTGVGKTETTKALAENFFESEDNIIRLDMSEYTGEDAVERLIGGVGAKDQNTGTLSEKLSEKQYGVLLLDEFEKTTPKVMDLFLQILDEGQFTDARGQKINARNLLIVATSNAGSDMIYAQKATKDQIVDEIIKRKIFKPELLNRFDNIVLFHPLDADHLRKIAKLMLKKLDARLADKGIGIDVNDDLLNYLTKIGNNPKFGARAMNRAIQNNVEGLIADKIISGEIAENSHVTFRVKNTESVSADDRNALEIIPVSNII